MIHKIVKILTLSISIVIGSLIGLQLRQDDAEAGIEFLIPYYLWIICYIIFAVAFFSYRRTTGRNSKLVKPFILSLIILIVVPFIFSGEKAIEQSIQRTKFKKQEYEIYLSKLENLDTQLELYPDSATLYVTRGRLKRSQGLWEESIVNSQISLKKQPTTDAYWELGWCQEHLGYFEEALISYQKAAILDPTLEWPQKRIDVVERRLKEASNKR